MCRSAHIHLCMCAEAPRTAGRSESPAVPKKLLSRASPKLSDVVLMEARADQQPPADSPDPKGDGAAPCVNVEHIIILPHARRHQFCAVDNACRDISHWCR